MIVVFAIDALEYKKVEEYNCVNLKQEKYGKTDISGFSQPRTMVLWSSFMTGKNKEKEVLNEGDKEMWNKRWKTEETFFEKFKDPAVIDLPGYTYELDAHEKSRKLLKEYFESEDPEEKKKIKEKYNRDAMEHHKKIKQEFFKAFDDGHDFVLGYFSVVDVIGHLNFGNNLMMRMLYKEMDDIAKTIKEKYSCPMLILSDHGMKAIGKFGDHSEYGFWSVNLDEDIENPRITDFFKLLTKLNKKLIK
jgi:hypothetical protein